MSGDSKKPAGEDNQLSLSQIQALVDKKQMPLYKRSSSSILSSTLQSIKKSQENPEKKALQCELNCVSSLFENNTDRVDAIRAIPIFQCAFINQNNEEKNPQSDLESLGKTLNSLLETIENHGSLKPELKKQILKSCERASLPRLIAEIYERNEKESQGQSFEQLSTTQIAEVTKLHRDIANIISNYARYSALFEALIKKGQEILRSRSFFEGSSSTGDWTDVLSNFFQKGGFQETDEGDEKKDDLAPRASSSS